jgi:hypothetical protein
MLHLSARPAVVRDPDDIKQVRRAERLERKRNQTLRNALALVLALPEGRLIWSALLDSCRVDEPTFSTDALEMAYLNGRRALGCELKADVIEVDSRIYILMEQEAIARMAREDAEIEAHHTRSASDKEGDE